MVVGGDGTLKVCMLRMDFGQDCFSGDVGFEVIFAGCKRALQGDACQSCHSPHLWDFSQNDQELSIEELRGILKKFSFDAFILLGGEPLDQNLKELAELLITGKTWTRYTMVWSGYELNEVLKMLRNNDDWVEVFKSIDYIKLGRYKPELPPKGKLASSNQSVYKVKTFGRDVFKFEEVEFY